MPRFPLFILVIILVILQLSVLDVFFGFPKSPNVVLAFVVSLTVLSGLKDGLGWIILSGLLLDAGAGWLFGTSALLLVIVAWAVENLKNFSDIGSLRRLAFFPSFAAIMILSVFVCDWAGFWLFRLENRFWTRQNLALSFHPDADFFWKAVFTAFSGVIIYSMMKKFDGFRNRSGSGRTKKAAQ